MDFRIRNPKQLLRYNLLIGALFSVSLLFFSACSDEPPVKVDMSKRVANETLLKIKDKQQFSFGIGSMITPKEGYVYYRQMINYLEEHMAQSMQIVNRGTYDEINSLLENQQLDAAFVCGGPYVDGKDKFGLELLVQPVAKNGPIYFSYLIVPTNSPARNLEDLRGKVFAFADPKSNTGKIVPTYWLAKMGETPDSFFSKYVFTYAHDVSIQAVVDNLVDGAAVDSLIWEYLNNLNPEIGIKTRIIKRSVPFGIPPLVVRPDLPESTRQRLQDILLSMHDNPAGKKILDSMQIKRFILGDDADYNTIREMRNFTQKQNGDAK